MMIINYTVVKLERSNSAHESSQACLLMANSKHEGMVSAELNRWQLIAGCERGGASHDSSGGSSSFRSLLIHLSENK